MDTEEEDSQTGIRKGSLGETGIGETSIGETEHTENELLRCGKAVDQMPRQRSHERFEQNLQDCRQNVVCVPQEVNAFFYVSYNIGEYCRKMCLEQNLTAHVELYCIRMDTLPVSDVLHETIFPMLDYESRIHLNQCLPAEDRFRARFSKDDMHSHELFVLELTLRSKQDHVIHIRGTSRRTCNRKANRLLALLDDLRSHRVSFFMRNFPMYMSAVRTKLTHWQNPDHEDLRGAGLYTRRKFSKRSAIALLHIQNLVPLAKPLPRRKLDIPTAGKPVFL